MEIEDFYFMTLVSWRYHPGYQRDGITAPTLDQIANMVDEIIEVRNKRWPSLQQQE